MTDFIMSIASVIQREIKAVDTVAQNAANANTNGYKAVRSFSQLSGAAGAGELRSTGESLQMETGVEIANGSLKQTGLPADIAVLGDAWMVVQTPDGMRLTRDGHFHVGADGSLLTAQGFPVLGRDGALRIAGEGFSIAADGTINFKEGGSAQLMLVGVKSPQGLRVAAPGLYAYDGAFLAASKYTVHQGMLERSNVDMGSDMVRLMETTRHIESMQRALSAYDNLLNSGINQLGKE